ncbi:MAG: acyl-CoA dehydrogenase family protein [Haliea sp.]|nr:acyl-CoA dehydrogenase family protein [Haliea sp.]
MNLSLPEDSLLVRDMFQRLFATESTAERVRAAEPTGFDAALWRELVAIDAPFLRLAEEAGGSGMGLFDACLMMEEAGRNLAPVPLAEAVAALRLLGELGGAVAQDWIEKVRDGETILALALRQAVAGEAQLCPGAAVASGIVSFDGKDVVIRCRRHRLRRRTHWVAPRLPCMCPARASATSSPAVRRRALRGRPPSKNGSCSRRRR